MMYFHKIKHISFHGSVFQATVKLITRALIVIVIPFWGESCRLWARRGERGSGGGWIGEEYILVVANCQGSDSKHESKSCIGGCQDARVPPPRPQTS